MNRAFISLYFFIVTSVVLIGWGLNQFWENLAPEQQPSAEVIALLQLLEEDLLDQTQPQPLVDYRADAQRISQRLNVALEILPLDDMAQSSALQELHAGELLASRSREQIIWYKRLAQTDQVMMLSLPLDDVQESPWYNLLLIGFYLAIALVIYIWVWPLSRDSKKLEVQTRALGKDGVPETLNISPASTLYPLAQAFNQMAQRLRELIASHREMTNAVSHELRTPLARMKFALALIDEQQLDEKNRRQLRSVEQDVAEMEALISALLMYAGFEQKTQTLQQTPGHMLDLLHAIRSRFYRHNERNLQLEIIDLTDANPERMGEADSAVFSCEWKLMETVLQNLINNAAGYARTQIRVELSQSPTHFYIAVEDDGPGIAREQREKVFESFVRLYGESNSNTATGGFGLGLAIVKRIMQWHRGYARFIEPQVLGGARAEVCWPKRPQS
jgi:signal transduction histidine kinase